MEFMNFEDEDEGEDGDWNVKNQWAWVVFGTHYFETAVEAVLHYNAKSGRQPIAAPQETCVT